jgi:hypothetical protein
MTDTLCTGTPNTPGYRLPPNRRIADPAQALREIADSIDVVKTADGRTLMAFPADCRLLDYVDAFASQRAAVAA